MKKIYGDSFDEISKYKLYRNVYEIIHPTISKKNISSYRIVLKEELVPVRIFYPEKVSNLTSILIFIHGDSSVTGCSSQYSNICMEMAKNLNQLVIALDYEELTEKKFPGLYESCYQAIEYLYQEFQMLGFDTKKIVVAGDSTGASIVTAMGMLARVRKTVSIEKQILFYPALSGEYSGISQFSSISKNGEIDLLTIPHLQAYFKKVMSHKKDGKDPFLYPLLEKEYKNLPTTLIITGNMDPLRDEGYEYYQRLVHDNPKTQHIDLEFAGHGFLKSQDEEIKKKVFDAMLDFLK